jgi:hypothetical protein
MDAQLLALLYAVLGGISMGCYPAFIKTRAVLAVDVHPVVFQCYKSTMVLLAPRGGKVIDASSCIFS